MVLADDINTLCYDDQWNRSIGVAVLAGVGGTWTSPNRFPYFFRLFTVLAFRFSLH